MDVFVIAVVVFAVVGIAVVVVKGALLFHVGLFGAQDLLHLLFKLRVGGALHSADVAVCTTWRTFDRAGDRVGRCGTRRGSQF